MVVAGHVDGRGTQTHFMFSLNTGFGTVMTHLPCAVVYDFDGSPDRSNCLDSFSGISLGAGAGILWGRKVRLGLRVDGNLINAPQGGRGGMADALFVGRYHGPFIVEGGVGIGVSAAQSLDASKRGLGVALHAMGGLPISEHVAGTVRVASVIGGLGALTATIGLEWSF